MLIIFIVVIVIVVLFICIKEDVMFVVTKQVKKIN